MLLNAIRVTNAFYVPGKSLSAKWLRVIRLNYYSPFNESSYKHMHVTVLE